MPAGTVLCLELAGAVGAVGGVFRDLALAVGAQSAGPSITGAGLCSLFMAFTTENMQRAMTSVLNDDIIAYNPIKIKYS